MNHINEIIRPNLSNMHVHKVNSVQEACGSDIKIWILANRMKKQYKNIKMIDLLMESCNLRVWCSLFYFFMWFARFQILICELQSIWRKLLALSWLYKKNGLDCSILNVFPLYKSSFGLLSSHHNYYAQRWLNHIFSFARPSISMYCCFVTFSPQWISQVPTLFMTSLPHFFLSCYTIWQMDANVGVDR